MKREKITVIIPAYNAQKTIEKTCRRIDRKIVDEIIVVNDGSTDATGNILDKLKKGGILSFSHEKNRGYGASQKTGYFHALKMGAAYVVMLHADGQHDPKYLPKLIDAIRTKPYDLVLGSRIKNVAQAFTDRMPFHKIFFNLTLSSLANIILGTSLIEHHTGYRIFKREVLKKLQLDKLSDDFVFDQQIIISAALNKFRIGEVYTSCVYNPDASSINLNKSVKYGLGVVKNLFYAVFNRKKFL